MQIGGRSGSNPRGPVETRGCSSGCPSCLFGMSPAAAIALARILFESAVESV